MKNEDGRVWQWGARYVRRIGIAILAATLTGIALVFCTDAAADDAPVQPKIRNGARLQSGITQYTRFNAHNSDQTADEIGEGIAVTYYIAGIVDRERSIMPR